MTDSDTRRSASRIGDKQPSSAGAPEDGLEPDADLGSRTANKPVAQVAYRSPWYARLARALPRSTGWIATILVGSLLVPAITKQWSDRPKELEIKTTLIREISELTTDTVTTWQMELSSTTPAARLLEVRKAAIENASKAEKADAQKKYNDAFEAKVVETQRILGEKYLAWRNKGAAVKAQLLAYFSETHLADDWDALSVAVVSYTRLVSKECKRTSDVTLLRSYLGSDESMKSVQWQHLEKSPYTDSDCSVGQDFGSFYSGYSLLASQLLVKEQQILDSIMKADMVGFSKGWRDLLSDVVSGGA
jgi:hypothetical protein